MKINWILKQGLIVFLAATMPIHSARFLLAEDPGEDYSPQNASFEPQSSITGEAAKAVVGRVFGVRGEAGNIDYHVIEFTKVSPGNAAFRSALIPGWGQHFNRQRVKGTIFFLTFTAAAFGGLHLHSKSQHSYDDYKNLGVKDDPLYNDYQDQQTQALLLGATALILWGTSIFDAYRNAYNPLYSRNLKVDLVYRTDETSVRFSRKF